MTAVMQKYYVSARQLKAILLLQFNGVLTLSLYYLNIKIYENHDDVKDFNPPTQYQWLRLQRLEGEGDFNICLIETLV